MSMRILLVDDHEIMRDGLRLLLQTAPGVEIVGEAATGLDALNLVNHHHPDLAVLDIDLPDISGLEVARQIRLQSPATRVIILSGHGEPEIVAEGLRAGIAGYLVKTDAASELLRAIEEVMQGRMFLCARVTRQLAQEYVSHLQDESAAQSPISPRERELLRHIAQGRSTKEIADALKISPKTVETHRANLMGKLNCPSIAELTRYAIRHGIAPL